MRTHIAVERPLLVTLPSFGITAFTSRHAVRFRMNAAAHPYHKIALVLVGNGFLEADSIDLPLREGAVVRIPAGLKHRFVDSVDAPMTLTMLCVSEAATRQLPSHMWSQAERIISIGRPHRLRPVNAAGVRRLTRQVAVVAVTGGPFVAAEITALATQILVRLLTGLASGENDTKPVAFAESLDWLDRHFTQALRVDELAARAGMSYRGYTAAFRRHTGTTLVQYVTSKRLTLAARLVRETGDILTSALEAGFGDLSHFYRAFARRFGHPPGRLRGATRTAPPRNKISNA